MQVHRLIALPAAAHGPRSVVINLIDSHRVKVYHSHNCIHIKTDAAVHIFFFFRNNYQNYETTRDGNECDYFHYTTGMFANQKDINFNENIRGMRNPFEFQVNQYSV